MTKSDRQVQRAGFDGSFSPSVVPRRSGLRVIAATGIAIVGFFIVAQTLGQVMRNDDPVRAYQLAAWDGRNGAALAEALAVPTIGDRTRADNLARTALRQDPTALAAVATLASDAKIGGRTAESERLFAYSELLSRRNLSTQLWAIETAVARGNIPEALRHYDIALRTKPKAYDVLFPVLASAIEEPAIRNQLVITLAQRPAWGASFMSYAAVAGHDPRWTAQLFIELLRAGVPIARTAQARLISALIGQNLYEQAWTSYAAGYANRDPGRSRDPAFVSAVADEAPTAFDWVPVGGAGISASFQSSRTRGLFAFSAGANAAGDLLQQQQLLPPGDYRLSGRSIALDQPEASRPYWVLRCQPDGRELGRILLPNSGDKNGLFEGRFRVPPGCRLQTLALVAQPTVSIYGVSGQIERVQLVPERN